MAIKKLYTIGLLAGLFSQHALAGPADYVNVPNVEYGEKEIDFKTGTAKLDNGERAQQSSIGLGYGVTEYWFTEVYYQHEREGSDAVSIAEWENLFQLTETGKYPVDIGLDVEIEAPLNKNQAYELTVKPLFQTEFGKVQLNGNPVITSTYGPGQVPTTLGYQWQVKYRWKPAFEFGMQGFGNMGKWSHWDAADEQDHKMGPAVFGKFDLGSKQAIKYNAAMLFGTSEAAANSTYRLQVEYEF
jgi:hypothetical protein